MANTPQTNEVHAERITNAIAAYYHVPPVWIGEDPFKTDTMPRVSTLQKEAFSKSYPAGINVWVQRDGLFIFDFSKWEPGSPVPIPAVKTEPGKRMPKILSDAHDQAILHVYRRVEVMNAHLACLNTAISTCEKKSLPVGQVINPSEYLNVHRTAVGTWWFGLNQYWKPIHAYIAAHRSFTGHPQSQGQRNIIEMQSVSHSFDLLEQLLQSPFSDSMTLITLLLQSVKSYGEHDFSSSLIISWTVLEKLVSNLWEKMVESNRRQGEPPSEVVFINDGRKKRLLEGRDYSASVRIEMLSLMKMIDLEMYDNLNKVRNARNDWLHSLEAADDEISSLAIQTAQRLLKQITGIGINLSISHGIEF